MNAYTELRMPAYYVDMSQKEMEYDESWGFLSSIIRIVSNSWFIIGFTAAGVMGTTFGALDGLSLTIGICGSTFDLCDWLRKNIGA